LDRTLAHQLSQIRGAGASAAWHCTLDKSSLSASLSLPLALGRRVFFQPFVYQRMSLQFRLFTWSGHDLPGFFNARRMNGHGPLFSFDPSADGISYASVFHWIEFAR
jgi:hypothetical protein